MKKKFLVPFFLHPQKSAIFLLFIAKMIESGAITGVITNQKGNPIDSATVSIHCEHDSTSTYSDSMGAYSLFIQKTGNCTLTVSKGTDTTKVDIISSNYPVEYNVSLGKKGNE